MDKTDIDKLTSKIIQCAYKVYSALGYGFLESVYCNSMLIELQNARLKVEKEKELRAYYKGQEVGIFRVDILVEDEVIVELKTMGHLIEANLKQLDNYLSVTNKSDGLLINFSPNGVEVKRRFGKLARERDY